MLQKNMHQIDTLIRFVVGVALVWVGFVDGTFVASNLINWAIGSFGVLNLISAVAGFCPVYSLAGFSTRLQSE